MKHLVATFLLAFSTGFVCHAQTTNTNQQETLDAIYSQVERMLAGESASLFDVGRLQSAAVLAFGKIASPTVEDLQKYNGILSMINVANVLNGDYDAAKGVLQEAVRAIRTVNNIPPLDKAMLLSSWPEALQLFGEEKEARAILNEILEIYADNDEDCDEYANALCAYASMVYQEGNTQLAETFCKRALEMNQRLHGEGTNVMGIGIYGEMATIKARHKDYEAAISFLDKVLESANLFGGDVSQYFKLYGIRRLELLEKLGKYDKITEVVSQSVKELIDYVRQRIAGLNSYQRANFIDNTNSFFGSTIPYYASIIDNPQLKDLAYNSQLFVKGLQLNADLEIERTIEKTGDTSLAASHAEISRLSHEISQINPNNEANVEKAKQLNTQLRQKETELMKKLHERGIDPTADLVTDWTRVRDVLRKDEAAIEFVIFRPSPTARTFGCLLVKPESEHPQYIKLYTTHDYPSDEVKQKQEQYPYTIWETLKSYLGKTKTVYFSPVADLHKLPIEHINTEKLGMKLIRVSSTRQLTLNNNYVGNMAMAIGGVDYDCETGDSLVADGTAGVIFRDVPLFDRGAAMRLSKLPGTLAEAKQIAEVVNENKGKGHFKGVKADLAVNTIPTETFMKQLSGQNIRFLHIGTHGFYSTEKHESKDDEQESELMSMRRCGLCMAGANRSLRAYKSSSTAGIKGDDGILTASEIASLDFSGMEFVSLSACQSGLGDISYDGVFGLQRAFKKAGAGSLLMSLWNVDDAATMQLIVNFYSYMCLDGATKYDALEKAKKDLRSNPKYDNPKYWAAFVLLDALD